LELGTHWGHKVPVVPSAITLVLAKAQKIARENARLMSDGGAEDVLLAPAAERKALPEAAITAIEKRDVLGPSIWGRSAA
jgi:hypothetical protein